MTAEAAPGLLDFGSELGLSLARKALLSQRIGGKVLAPHSEWARYSRGDHNGPFFGRTPAIGVYSSYWWTRRKCRYRGNGLIASVGMIMQPLSILPRATIQQSPEFTDESLLTRNYEIELHGHYPRQGYWMDEPVAKWNLDRKKHEESFLTCPI
jgi:hypothetical protein